MVSLEQLQVLVGLTLAGCPQCRSKFEEKAFSINGACFKVKLVCSERHVTAWSSSECMSSLLSHRTVPFLMWVGNANGSLQLNSLLPIAASLTGIRSTSLLEFLALLQIDSFTEQWMKEDSIDLLADITEQKWATEMATIREEINQKEFFDASFDEQHSRPQRFTYGHAPFATCTIMDGDGRIINMSHVDSEAVNKTTHVTKAGEKCKSKAKVAHCNSFTYLRANFTSRLRHLTSDQSADGKSDAEAILRAKWPGYTMNFDLWHKTYPMTANWKKFVTQRTRRRGPFKYPRLHALWESKQLGAHSFKKWWINCSEVCDSCLWNLLLFASHSVDVQRGWQGVLGHMAWRREAFSRSILGT
jgi:hypothetical protein